MPVVCATGFFYFSAAMQKLILIISALFSVLCLFACSDSTEGTDYLFDRAVQDVSVLRECPANADSGAACYELRYRIPIETEKLVRIHFWVDTTYIDDTTKSVPDGAKEHSIKVEYVDNDEAYDTLDLTSHIKDYLDRDSLAIAIWCEYSGGDEGAVQHLYIHFGDDMPPSTVTAQDSVWTTGAVFDWTRPTDQVDYYKPSELDGKIMGYNIVLYAEDTTEDIRNLRLKLTWNSGVDSTGNIKYKRNARFRAVADSVWIDTVSHGDNVKNYLRIAVKDSLGFDFENDSSNRFRLTVEGLKAESRYTIGITAWDSAGNASSGASSVTSNQLFITTDSIAPLMPTKLWVRADSAHPETARLDSNRVIIYWSRSVDPLTVKHGITVDTALIIPYNCSVYTGCYRDVASYEVDLWNGSGWESAKNAGGTTAEKYSSSYARSGDSMVVSTSGTYIADTLRWVVPSDTLIVRIRSVDSSGYYSKATIDTIAVTLGPEADLNCPAGFVPVRSSDTSRFCIEKYEHKVTDSTFAHNVIYSEAAAACSSVTAAGFAVSLCKIADWETACTARKRVTYGVIEETDFSASEYLFSYCNVGTDDSTGSALLSKRNAKCVSPDGVHDMPGSYQEWVTGSKADTLQVLKGTSYSYFSGEDRTGLAKCTTRSYPYRNRAAFTKDTVYLYRESSKVDTTTTKDTSRTLYAILTQKNFTDTLQYFKVINPATKKVVGEDYIPLAEYRRRGDAWLATIANGLTYEKDSTSVVFLLGTSVPYIGAASFYKDASIGFRCCAYVK